MKRSDVKLNQAIDELEDRAAEQKHVPFLDELVVMAATENVLNNLTALTLYMAAIFPQQQMRVGGLIATVDTQAGSSGYRLALYKAIRPYRAATGRFRIVLTIAMP